MAVCLLMHLWLSHCYREQAPSHSLISIYQVDISPRLTRRPAGLATLHSLRSASVVLRGAEGQKPKQGAAALKPTGIASVDRGPNVGGGLPPMAVCQLMHLCLSHCYREQAASHSLISIHQVDISPRLTRRPAGLPTLQSLRSASVVLRGAEDQKPRQGAAALGPTGIAFVDRGSNVGGGLPPMAVCLLMHLWLSHCYREQAPSHSLISIYQVDISPRLTRRPAGLATLHSLRSASVVLRGAEGQKPKQGAAALKPTGIASVDRGPNVGGGLPPMAVCQLMHLCLSHCYREQAASHSLISMHQVDISPRLTRRPAGLATLHSLRSASVVLRGAEDQKPRQGAAALEPTGIAIVDRGSNVGGGLPPMAVCQLMPLWLSHCYREQAPSHSLISMYQVDISLLLICF